MKQPKTTPDKHQHKIAVDTIRNPAKAFLGGMSEVEAIKILKTKFDYSDVDIKKLQEIKLTEQQVEKLTPIIRKIVNEVKTNLNEEQKMLDTYDLTALKTISKFVDGLAGLPSLRHATKDSNVREIEDQISALRIELMQYVEDNSGYQFIGKSPNGWKLVKKKK